MMKSAELTFIKGQLYFVISLVAEPEWMKVLFSLLAMVFIITSISVAVMDFLETKRK